MKKFMKNYYLTVRSLGAAVKVVSSERSWTKKLKNSKFLKRYIPCYEISEDDEGAGCVLTLKSGRPRFSLEFPRATYSNLKYDEKDIVSLIEFLLERLRQEGGCFCMHSSSVAIGDQGVIFWGWASGLGKTRLVLNLVKNFGVKFFSDEKTLIDLKNVRMLGGAASAYLSKNYFKKYHQNKKFYDFTAPCAPAKIAFLAYPQVSESKKLFIEKWSSEKLDWHLYEELSRKIRAISRRLFKNTLPVPSLDTPALSQKRSLEIKKFVKRASCYYMRGTEKQISEKILKMLDKFFESACNKK